jgi:hypothetical protein
MGNSVKNVTGFTVSSTVREDRRVTAPYGRPTVLDIPNIPLTSAWQLAWTGFELYLRAEN